MADHALEFIAFEFEPTVPSDWADAVGTQWTDRPNAGLALLRTDGVALMALVGDRASGRLLGQCGHVFERRAVHRFAANEGEGER